MRQPVIVLLVALVGVGTGLPWMYPLDLTALTVQDNPVVTSEESVAAGRTTYVRFCASCHGTRGLGDGSGAFSDTKPANLVDAEWDHGSTDAEIFKTIAEGVPPEYAMEEWLGRISEEDIWNVVNYLRDLAAQ